MVVVMMSACGSVERLHSNEASNYQVFHIILALLQSSFELCEKA